MLRDRVPGQVVQVTTVFSPYVIWAGDNLKLHEKCGGAGS